MYEFLRTLHALSASAALPLLVGVLALRWLADGPRFRRAEARVRLAESTVAAAGLAVALVLAGGGAVLYFQFSPFTAGMRANADVMLHDPTLRYWNVIHPALGLAASAVAIVALRWRGHTSRGILTLPNGFLLLGLVLLALSIP